MKTNSTDRKTAQINQDGQHRSLTRSDVINEQIEHDAKLEEGSYRFWSKNWTELNLQEVMALQISEVGSYCERVLDLPTLMQDLIEFTQGRKRFCEYLGIGESTLSGWLKEQRVPRMAKEAYVLLKALLLLQDELTRLNEQKLRNDVVMVQEGDRFQLVRFKADNTGALMGTIIARDISDQDTARILAGSTKALDTLAEVRNYQIEEELDSFKPLDYRILRDSLAAFGIEEWIKRFLPHRIDAEETDAWRAWQVLAEVDPARAQEQLTGESRLRKLRAEEKALEEAAAKAGPAIIARASARIEATAKAIETQLNAIRARKNEIDELAKPGVTPRIIFAAAISPEFIAKAETEIKAAQADLKALQELAAEVSPPSSARGDSGSKQTAVEENSPGKRGANGKAKT